MTARRATHALSRIPVQPFREKQSASVFRKSVVSSPPSHPAKRGGSRSSRTWGRLRWTRRRRVRCNRRAMQVVTSCGVRDERRCCGRRSRVVLAPHGRRQGSLVSRGAQPGCEARYQRTDEVNTANGPREEREGSRKTIAWGMPADSGASAVNTRVLAFFYYPSALEAAPASGTGHSPRPLFDEGGDFGITSGQDLPASVKSCLAVC